MLNVIEAESSQIWLVIRMSNSSRSYHRVIKRKLEETFLGLLQSRIDRSILELEENNPLIKDERQMRMEHTYSPTCDVAIGPFSFREGSLNELYCHIASLDEIDHFIGNLQDISLGTGYNETLLDLNTNPRCFMAIEVENTTARDVKHLLGSITNCSFLAKIGVVIVFDEYLDYAKRLLAYLAFVKRVKKTNKELFRNVFVVSRSSMNALLQISE